MRILGLRDVICTILSRGLLVMQILGWGARYGICTVSVYNGGDLFYQQVTL
jgi:hypothetical protein